MDAASRWEGCTISSQLSESFSFLSGPMMKTALMVSGRSLLSLLLGSSMPSAHHEQVWILLCSQPSSIAIQCSKAGSLLVLSPLFNGPLAKLLDCHTACCWIKGIFRSQLTALCLSLLGSSPIEIASETARAIGLHLTAITLFGSAMIGNSMVTCTCIHAF